MNVRPVTAFAYVLLVAAAVISIVFVHSLKPTSVKAAIFFSICLLLPYLILAIVLAIRAHVATEIADLIVTVLVVAGGLLFLTIVVFVRPDPQGGIAVLFTPVYQGIAMVILVPLSRWISGKGT
jgi:peptidoglycan/LPS O-acetylase OafA/YrhL